MRLKKVVILCRTEAMEKKTNGYFKYFVWVIMILHCEVWTARADDTDNSTLPDEVFVEVGDDGHVRVSGYTWSPWGSWSPCTRTCGGGVAVQERRCLPKKSISSRELTVIPGALGTLAPPVVSVRITRQASTTECVGEARRYHECNIAPCSGSSKDTRAQQCSSYDRRPFRGRFYTWTPYVDGDSPCTLNCRPLGQHFYASLAVVADGTPCTKPGFRAICVQGICKVVGRDSVLASTTSKDLRCGRRLVSGLFSRPRLPLGYSYIATVPKGACRLNVTVMLPSENYIALKLVNSSYIINGEFAVSSSGSYEAAGTRFVYTRKTSQDSVYAHGPILQPVDIMILYTQPNPSIKYEYLTESGESKDGMEFESQSKIPDTDSSGSSKHARRHHNSESLPRINQNYSTKSTRHPQSDTTSYEDDNAAERANENAVGSRNFLWKILSFSQCSRSCGGGMQLGKYRCVEASYNGIDREVSPVHCVGSPPTSRRRRCGSSPCFPRWRSAAWSTCPSCGPANRTRIVGCVQDHSRGITKISDVKCPPSKPITIELCNIPDCNNSNVDELSIIDPKRQIRQREQIDAFHEGPVYTVSVNGTDHDIGPEYSFNAVGGWLHSEWSECVGWCVGGGLETRGVRCADPAGCPPHNAPESSRTCSPKLSCDKHEGQWFTGEWSACSSPCSGRQVRGVLCIGGSGRHLRESACKGPRPDHQQQCGPNCTPTWYYSDWSQCMGGCETGVGLQRRTVWCARGDGPVTQDADCGSPKPMAQKPCNTPQCPAKAATTVVTSTDVTIEPQTKTDNEIPKDNTLTDITSTECEDRLRNCQLAVQARLCHYNYYSQSCCHSCHGR